VSAEFSANIKGTQEFANGLDLPKQEDGVAAWFNTTRNF
jgi:hypothetical protein